MNTHTHTHREMKQLKSRYYLHRKVRQHFGFRVDAHKKQISVPNSRSENICNDPNFRYIRDLQAMGYNVQTFID